jgi:hypothetical protein
MPRIRWVVGFGVAVGCVLALVALVAVSARRDRPAPPLAVLFARDAAPQGERSLDEIAIRIQPTGATIDSEPVGLLGPVEEAVAEVAEQQEASKPRVSLSEEETRKQLLQVPALQLDPTPPGTTRPWHLSDPWSKALKEQAGSTEILELASRRTGLAASRIGGAAHPTLTVLAKRSDLAGLPLRGEAECTLDKEAAQDLRTFSREIRALMGNVQKEKGDLAESLRDHLRRWRAVQRVNYRKDRLQTRVIPTLMQMLTAESTAVRLVLVENLAETEDAKASAALARLALFDVSEEVRTAALAGLSGRPGDEYQPILLNGLRYPWAPVAEHAAHALVTLKRYAAAPALTKLLKEPDPSAPFYEGEKRMVRELVRINHLRNCLMCHAPSRSMERDVVRGQVPNPGRPLPPVDQYYDGGEGIFVRADVTYLKQDFAVMQPVGAAAPWPEMQRFDFVVRTRPATEGELAIAQQKGPEASYPQREAVRWALKELGW